MAHDTTHRRQAETVRNQYAQRVAATRSDPRLSDEARRRLLSHHYVTARNQLRELAKQHTDVVESKRTRLTQSVFGHQDDPDALRLAIEAASSRITTGAEALTALRRAERTADPVLAKAILNIAHERAWTPVINAYMASRTGERNTWNELQEHQSASDDPSEKLFGPLKPVALPDELAKYQNIVERLAAESGEPPKL
jgi:hypothetical protein